MKTFLLSLALLFCGSRAAMPSEFVVTLDAEASQEEKFAASMLHKYLPASGVGSDGGHRTKLMVGKAGAAALSSSSVSLESQSEWRLAEEALSDLDKEQADAGEGYSVVKLGNSYALSGDKPDARGTVYAAFRWLQEVAGYRFWEPTPPYERASKPSTAKLEQEPEAQALDLERDESPAAHHPAFGLGPYTPQARPQVEEADLEREQTGVAVKTAAFEEKATSIHEEGSPLDYRELYTVSGHDEDWSLAMGLHGGFDQKNALEVDANPARFGKLKYADKYAVHTAFTLAPPEKHRSSHPDWYGGEQLCWLGEGLAEHLIQEVKGVLRAAPQDVTAISISQMDNMNPCRKGMDLEVSRKEGSLSAPMMVTVNKVADAIREEWPHVKVDTLAYQHTRAPPKTIKPAPNVIVRLCTIEANFATPIAVKTGKRHTENNEKFMQDLEGWGKLHDDIYVWDYVTAFDHTLLPWPNYYSLGPNMKTFTDNNVKGVFAEGNYFSRGGELNELKSYMVAKLMWDPKQDSNKLMREFLDGYYGAAAPQVKQYMDTVHKSALDHGTKLEFNIGPEQAYLSPDVILSSLETFRKGREAVGEPYLQRMKIAEMAPMYVLLLRWEEMRGHAQRKGMQWPVETDKMAVLARFKEAYKKNEMSANLVPGGDGQGPIDKGLSEHGHGIKWLEEVVANGRGMSDLEREYTPPHRAFMNGPY